MKEAQALAQALLKGDRRALSKAITLVESKRPDHVREAEKMLELLLPHTGKARRIGIAGPPGSGKSTLIETLGPLLLQDRSKLAILTVDPLSPISGGSILGDKTRMEGLAQHSDVYIRPSPGAPGLGGIAARSYEAMLVCEAAGYDWVLLETIGTGQSEIAVAEMTDMFIALVAPGGGDDLQGMKRGIMELADLLVVTKADGDLLSAAGRIEASMNQALRLMRPRRQAWRPEALTCSSYEKKGIRELAQKIDTYFTMQAPYRTEDRRLQSIAWFRRELQKEIEQAFLALPGIRPTLQRIEEKIGRQMSLPSAEAKKCVAELFAQVVGRN